MRLIDVDTVEIGKTAFGAGRIVAEQSVANALEGEGLVDQRDFATDRGEGDAVERITEARSFGQKIAAGPKPNASSRHLHPHGLVVALVIKDDVESVGAFFDAQSRIGQIE